MIKAESNGNKVHLETYGNSFDIFEELLYSAPEILKNVRKKKKSLN